MNVLRGNLLPVVIPQKIFKNRVYVSCLFILTTKKVYGDIFNRNPSPERMSSVHTEGRKKYKKHRPNYENIL